MKKNTSKWVFGGIGLFILLLVGLSLVSNKYPQSAGGITGLAVANPLKVCKNVPVEYQTQEAYTEQEPYTAIEQETIPLKYEISPFTSGYIVKGLNYLTTATTRVKNVDSETGTLFTVTFTFQTLNDPAQQVPVSQYVMPGETKTFYAEYDNDLGENVKIESSIIPGTKTVSKQVTKYKDVTKYRTVTKTRTEERCD